MGALLMIVDAGAIVTRRLDRPGIDNDNNFLKPCNLHAVQPQTDHPFSGGNDGEINILRAGMVLELE